MSDWLNEWINSSGNFLAGGIHLKKNLGADITVLWLQSHYVKWEDSRHRRIPACLREVWSLFRKSVQTHWNNWIISTNLKFEGNQYACLQSIKKIDLYRVNYLISTWIAKINFEYLRSSSVWDCSVIEEYWKFKTRIGLDLPLNFSEDLHCFFASVFFFSFLFCKIK